MTVFFSLPLFMWRFHLEKSDPTSSIEFCKRKLSRLQDAQSLLFLSALDSHPTRNPVLLLHLSTEAWAVELRSYRDPVTFLVSSSSSFCVQKKLRDGGPAKELSGWLLSEIKLKRNRNIQDGMSTCFFHLSLVERDFYSVPQKDFPLLFLCLLLSARKEVII